MWTEEGDSQTMWNDNDGEGEQYRQLLPSFQSTGSRRPDTCTKAVHRCLVRYEPVRTANISRTSHEISRCKARTVGMAKQQSKGKPVDENEGNEQRESDDHLSDLPDGSGCVEIWERLSENRSTDDDD